MFEIEAEKRTDLCKEAYDKGFKEGVEYSYNKAKKLLSFWVNDFYDNTSSPIKYEERHKVLVETEQFLKGD